MISASSRPSSCFGPIWNFRNTSSSGRATCRSGQLEWRLRTDPRVTVREHVNARFLTRADLPGPFDIITIDVSFISLRHILPVVPPLLADDGDVIALVKPQFEAGRKEVQSGGPCSIPTFTAAS